MWGFIYQVVFLVKGPIYLVCISCTDEPYESLKGQLELLYGQVSCPIYAETLDVSWMKYVSILVSYFYEGPFSHILIFVHADDTNSD